MLGLLFAAFESMTGRAKGPVEKSKREMEEDVKGNDVNAERERAKGNVKGTRGANEVP
jgi:hypothetical protein